MEDPSIMADAKRDYFNELAPSWDEKVGNDETRHAALARVFDRIEIPEGGRVLDAGCGTGVLFRHIIEKTGSGGMITAVDYAPAMLDRARELHPDYENIDYRAGDAASLDLEENFYDTILCFAVLPHVEDKGRFLATLRHAIRDDGRLYIFHLADTATLNSFHSGLNAPVRGDLLPERRELEELLTASGFSPVVYIDEKGLNFSESRPCRLS
jgi:demethylmenaquinone methyltransferase/2-methoxy-6-polyprenyl-1,4-benzoquinol methylase